MSQLFLSILLWACAIGSGLIAGIFFAFSTFIMTAFSRIPQSHGMLAMQSINMTILRSLFMPIFFGTAIGGLVLIAAALLRWGEPSAMVALAASVLYIAGMFLSTIIFNVPLNNALASVDAGLPEATVVWARYLRKWTAWNHVRTVASMVSHGLFILAIALQ